VTPTQLLSAAEGLLERPDAASRGLWGRAAALLIRQAIEAAAGQILAEEAPGAQAASFAAQWVLLPEVCGDADLGRRASWAWASLTSAVHADELRLAPTADELRHLCAVGRALAAEAGSQGGPGSATTRSGPS